MDAWTVTVRNASLEDLQRWLQQNVAVTQNAMRSNEDKEHATTNARRLREELLRRGELQVPVRVGKGQMAHLLGPGAELVTRCGKTGAMTQLVERALSGYGANCRGCNGDAAAVRRFR